MEENSELKAKLDELESLRSKAKEDRLNKTSFFVKCQTKLKNFLKEHKGKIKFSLCCLLHALIIVYFCYAAYWFDQTDYPEWHWTHGFGLLFIIILCIYFIYFKIYVFNPYLREKYREKIGSVIEKQRNKFFNTWYLHCSFYLTIIVIIVIYVIVDSLDEPIRILSIVGYVLIYVIGLMFSKYPGDVKVQSVMMGVVLQMLSGLLILKCRSVRTFFVSLDRKIKIFFDYSLQGANFNFSDNLMSGKFNLAFQVLSMIFFWNALMNIFYYYGVIQKVVVFFGGVVEKLMGTTVIESINSMNGMFIGHVECPVTMKIFIKTMTKSEICAMMITGFCSINPVLLGWFVRYGAKSVHLICAMVMSFPASLSISKLFYPEIEETLHTDDHIIEQQVKAFDFIDAACRGATEAMTISLGIISNFLAILSFMLFLDSCISWCCELTGLGMFDECTLENVVGTFLMPVFLFMGVPWNDCYQVGYLFCNKILLNEYFAFYQMGEVIKQGYLSERGEIFATFLLCGWANPASIGATCSIFILLAPTKKKQIMTIVYRAFIGGICVSLTNACVANMFIRSENL